jgi:hypothetical protein
MHLPKQSAPVRRQPSQAKLDGDQIGPSNIACNICMTACDQLGGIAKSLCILACQKTVC